MSMHLTHPQNVFKKREKVNMSDLVRRLRELTCNCYDAEVIETSKDAMDEAADRIEKLEAANLKASLIKVDHLSRIKKLEAALARIAKHDLQAIAMDALRPGERIRKALEGKND